MGEYHDEKLYKEQISFFASHNCMCHYNKITTSTNSEVKILYKIPRCQFGQPLPHRKVTAGFYYITFHWRIAPDCIHHLCVPRINPGNRSNPRWFTSVVKALKNAAVASWTTVSVGKLYNLKKCLKHQLNKFPPTKTCLKHQVQFFFFFSKN